MDQETNSKNTREKSENSFVSLIFNIAIPVLILFKFTKLAARFFPDVQVSPVCVLLVALAFPVIYFIYDYVKNHKPNFISIIGFISILLTGVIGAFQFPSEWIAYKEAAVPFIIGMAILISLKTPYPLVRKLLYNKDLIDIDKVDSILDANHSKEKFDKILVNSTYLLAFSFLVSTILNFTLAKLIIHSPSGTEAFNQELAKMTGLSWPVIALPSTLVMMLALWYLIHNVKKLTGLSFDDMLAPHLRDKMDELDKKEEKVQNGSETDPSDK